ncbi:MAG TPA: PilN domain-containing protein [Gaiellaceae bacterium]
MRAVNLLPGESSRASRGAPQPAVLTGAIASVVVIAVIGGGNLLQTSRVATAQKTLNSAKIQLAATPLPPKTPHVTPPPPAVAQQMQPRLTAVSDALSTRIAWDRILREFSLVLPPDIQLNSLTLTAPASSTASSSGLVLSGLTFSYDSVARLLSRMALIPDLSGVTLTNTGIAQNVVSFTINADIKGGAAPVTPVAPTAPTTTTTSGTA